MAHIPVHNHTNPQGIYEFDARGIAKRFRCCNRCRPVTATPSRLPTAPASRKA